MTNKKKRRKHKYKRNKRIESLVEQRDSHGLLVKQRPIKTSIKQHEERQGHHRNEPNDEAKCAECDLIPHNELIRQEEQEY